MIAKPSALHFLACALFVVSTHGCGTQVGNPDDDDENPPIQAEPSPLPSVENPGEGAPTRDSPLPGGVSGSPTPSQCITEVSTSLSTGTQGKIRLVLSGGGGFSATMTLPDGTTTSGAEVGISSTGTYTGSITTSTGKKCRFQIEVGNVNRNQIVTLTVP